VPCLPAVGGNGPPATVEPGVLAVAGVRVPS